MVRLFILTLTLCSLLQLQLTSFGFVSKAYAEDNPTYAKIELQAEATPGPLPTYSAADAQAARAEGKKVEASNTFDDRKGKIGNALASGFVELLTMLSIAAVGANLLFACQGARSNLEVISFAAGSAAYIAGEVQAWLRYKKAEGILVELSRNQDNVAQIEALKQQKKNYENLKGVATLKYTLHLAAATAFSFAAGIAIYNGIFHKAKLKVMETKYQLVANACTANCAGLMAAAPACTAAMQSCNAGIGAFKVKNTLIEKQSLSFQPSATLFNTVLPMKKMNNLSLDTSCLGAKPVCGPLTIAGTEWKLAKTMQERTLISCPTLEESVATSGISKVGLTAKVFGFFKSIFKPVAKWMDKFMFHPFKRAAVFGTCATLAGTSAALTKGNIKKIDSYIEKIDAILAKFDATTATMTGAMEGNTDVPLTAVDPNNRNAITSKYPCVMVGNSTAGCGSVRGAYNQTIKESSNGQGVELNGFGPGVASLGTTAANLADQLQGSSSVSSGALSSASDLASKNAIGKNFLDGAKKALEKEDKDASNELKKATDEFLTGMTSTAEKALKENGTNAAAAMAAFGMMDPVTKSEEKKKGTLNEKASVVVPSGKNAVANIKDEGFSASGDFVPVDVNATASETAALPVDMVVDETKAGDINNNSEKPIFEIITQRYFKSGLDKLGIQTKSEVKPAATATPKP